MKRILTTILLICLTACGSIFSGTTQNIQFDANEKDVKIFIDGFFACKTPCATDISRAYDGANVRFEKEGFVTQSAKLKTRVNNASFFNLIFLYSWTTDALSGGLWKYNQDSIFINMEKEKMKKAERDIFEKDTEIRRFVLFNFDNISAEAISNQNGEYIQTLSQLSGIDGRKLTRLAKDSNNAVNLADKIIKNRVL